MSTQRTFFTQDPPVLNGNQFLADVPLLDALSRIVPPGTLSAWMPELTSLGAQVATGGLVERLGTAATNNPPTLKRVDAWGRRIDEIVVAREWTELHGVAAKEGIVAAAYDSRKLYGAHARVLQFVKLFMYAPVSAIVTCPLAMTDGAARLIEQLKTRGEFSSKRLDRMFQELTSRDPANFATSGQWMTETTGGSDLSRTQTEARKAKGDADLYTLSGYKYFTSATTTEYAFTLARIIPQDGSLPTAGSRGLSLFVLDVRDKSGKLNNIAVHKLKEKMGTKPLPTAELELLGTTAYLIGTPGEGVKNISLLFNVTRIWAAMSAAAGMSRMTRLMRDYASKRFAFGSLLSEKPLHLQTLSEMEVEYRARLHVFLDLALLLGQSETKTDERTEALLRLLTPVAKLHGSKQAVAFMTEAVESFGGTGYMTDSGIAASVADSLVNCIWEGTTNVLSLDVLRVFAHDQSAFFHFSNVCHERAEKARKSQPRVSLAIDESLKVLLSYVKCLPTTPPSKVEAGARHLALSIGRLHAATLLAEHAAWSQKKADFYVSEAYVNREPLVQLLPSIDQSLIAELALGATPAKL